MIVPHKIRLVGPWEFQVADDPPQRVTMPVSWRELFGHRAQTVLFTRAFQWPGELPDGGSLHVVFTGVHGRGFVWLNDQPLNSFAASPETYSECEFDLSSAVQRSNRLKIELSFDPDQSDAPGGLYGPVVLEVREE